MKKLLKLTSFSVFCIFSDLSSACADEFDDAWYFYSNQDYKHAIPLLENQVQAGNPQAAQLLGLLYEFGTAVPKDYKKALDFYSFAAKGGSIAANFNIGELYFQGIGIDSDLEKARFWFQKGASRGSPLAQFRLGNIYQDGLGVQPDQKKAYVWFSLAVAGGYKEGNGPRATSLLSLSPSEKVSAQTELEDCQLSNLVNCPY